MRPDRHSREHVPVSELEPGRPRLRLQRRRRWLQRCPCTVTAEDRRWIDGPGSREQSIVDNWLCLSAPAIATAGGTVQSRRMDLGGPVSRWCCVDLGVNQVGHEQRTWGRESRPVAESAGYQYIREKQELWLLQGALSNLDLLTVFVRM